jgi:transcriptional regulator with XRE-family HTH domain
MGIGQRIKSVRQKKDISVATIAAAAGVKRQAVYQWENGDTKGLKGSHLVAVARVIDVSVEWLDTGKGPQGTFREAPIAQSDLETPPDDLSPEAIVVARTWMQLSPGRRTGFLVEMSWARFFESKFPPYRSGITNVASYDKFERSVEADWEKMVRQGRLAID